MRAAFRPHWRHLAGRKLPLHHLLANLYCILEYRILAMAHYCTATNNVAMYQQHAVLSAGRLRI